MENEKKEILYKDTQVIVDKKQIRTTIPKEFTTITQIQKGEYKISWSLDVVRKELVGILIKKSEGELK